MTEKQYIEAEYYRELKRISNLKSDRIYTDLQEFLKSVRPRKQRTTAQNRALHKYYSLVADALNEAGWTVQRALENAKERDWSGGAVKDLIWRVRQKEVLGKESTTELSKWKDIDDVYEIVNRDLGQVFGLHVPFPVDPKKQKELEESQAPVKLEIDYPESTGEVKF